jgi:tRNA A37 N6-isopentenylltransferase MiaA
MINLDADKNLLIERLDKRVDQMMERGLLDELSQFYDKVNNKI